MHVLYILYISSIPLRLIDPSVPYFNNFTGMTGGISGSTVSMYKTKVISSTLNPVWNEEGLVAGFTGAEDTLILTMFDRDLVKSDDFMGQNVVALKESSAALRRGEKIDLSLDIGSFSAPLKGVTGEAISVNGSETPGKGKLLLSLRMPPLAYTMCGWMYRLSHAMMSQSWKKRYFVLTDKKLYYFDSAAELNVVKGMIQCNTVTAIKSEKTKGVDYFSISYGTGKDKWDVRFVEEDGRDVVDMWKRKMSRSCHVAAGGTDVFRSALVGLERKPKK
jgi:hypothetical protein